MIRPASKLVRPNTPRALRAAGFPFDQDFRVLKNNRKVCFHLSTKARTRFCYHSLLNIKFRYWTKCITQLLAMQPLVSLVPEPGCTLSLKAFPRISEGTGVCKHSIQKTLTI